MDYLTCPQCQEAPLMKNEDGRSCVNCGYNLSEIDYNIFAAQQMENLAKEEDALERKSMKHVRAKFGRSARIKK